MHMVEPWPTWRIHMITYEWFAVEKHSQFMDEGCEAQSKNVVKELFMINCSLRLSSSDWYVLTGLSWSWFDDIHACTFVIMTALMYGRRVNRMNNIIRPLPYLLMIKLNLANLVI